MKISQEILSLESWCQSGHWLTQDQLKTLNNIAKEYFSEQSVIGDVISVVDAQARNNLDIGVTRLNQGTIKEADALKKSIDGTLKHMENFISRKNAFGAYMVHEIYKEGATPALEDVEGLFVAHIVKNILPARDAVSKALYILKAILEEFQTMSPKAPPVKPIDDRYIVMAMLLAEIWNECGKKGAYTEGRIFIKFLEKILNEVFKADSPSARVLAQKVKALNEQK